MNLIPFDQTKLMAEAIAKSKLFGIQTAEQALALGLLCQAEGRHPAEAARDYHIINGKPSLKSEAMLARFQQAGGRVEWHDYTHESVSGTFSHPQGGSLKVSWTIKDAERAGLMGNPTWKKFPRQMLKARCISEAVRGIFPAVLSGLYAPEEVQEFAPIQLEQEPTPTITVESETVQTAPEPVESTVPPMLERIPPIQRLLSDKTKAQKDKVTAGAIKRGWITEGQTYLDIPADIVTQAAANQERFFAAFGI
jgi:hypothetical protein